MLKGVKKGIKKKIKGKKDKKEDDLFDPVQLERYKRELEAKKALQQQEAEESGLSEAAGSSSAGHEDDDEWLKFKQLTSGVDVLVNKVSTDLDRIKESSFFQRNKPSEQNKLFASERPSKAPPVKQAPPVEEEVHEPEVTEEEAAAEDTVDDGAAKVPESPEDIVPVELDDSLFDTEFVDAIATGEIKLAYIPDSPTQEDDGDDPFDTHVYDTVVKKIEEAEKKAARQVNLGGAVDVLTGKSDTKGIARPRTKAGEMKAKARPRPHAVNLLGDFDDTSSMPTGPPIDYSRNAKSNEKVEKKSVDVFDQILGSPVKDTSAPLEMDILTARQAAANENKDNDKNEDNKGINKDVISEFDVISDLDPISGGGAEIETFKPGIPTSIPSSIAALLTTAPAEPEEDEWDEEFAALAAESVHKGPPPEEKAAVEKEEDEDPFDTSFVDKSAPHGKCELKIIEDEFLGDPQASDGTKDNNKQGADDDDDFDFNPRLGESPPKTLNIQNAPKINPLEDMSPSANKAPAIQPHVKAAVDAAEDGKDGEGTPESKQEEDIDPFDTSRLEAALPGKAELKLLEEELLSAQEQQREPPKLPETIMTAITKKQQTEDDDFDFDPRQDEVKRHVLDLHDAEHHAFDNVSKVMTPQMEKEVEIDPFDTSTVDALGLIPGALELKLLEDELVSPTVENAPVVNVVPAPVKKFTSTFSDDEDDFDPRCGVPAPVLAVANKPPEDIFDSAMDFAVDKPLTPQQEMPSQAALEPKLCPTNTDDPFDTSGIQIENYLAKSELKQVEEELLNAAPQPPAPTQSHQQQPARTLPVVVAVEYKRIPQQTIAPSQPPQPPPPAHPLEDTSENHAIKPLTPVEMPALMTGVVSVFNPSPYSDPFDTSIAEGVIPNRTEIKLLEEELGVVAGVPRSLSDDDFDPRQPSHPSHQMVSQPLTPMPATTATQQQPKVSSQIGGNNMEPDPFDTSAADGGTASRADFKALEAELL